MGPMFMPGIRHASGMTKDARVIMYSCTMLLYKLACVHHPGELEKKGKARKKKEEPAQPQFASRKRTRLNAVGRPQSENPIHQRYT